MRSAAHVLKLAIHGVWVNYRSGLLLALSLSLALVILPVAAAQAKPAPGDNPHVSTTPTPPLTEKTCRLCHTHGPGPKVDFSEFSHSVHGKLQCASCHRDINSVPHTRHLAAVDCGSCHVAIAKQYKAGTHGRLHAMGSEMAPTCTTCHGTHGIRNVNSAAFFQAMPTRCASCHSKAYASYRDTFHGQAAQLGMRDVATCWSCHDPHLALPPSNPKSRVAAANLITTCSQCHTGVNHNFIQFDVHPNPSDPHRSLAVYTAHIFMTCLLIFVFGFFGIHTLLWLQRSAVALIRHEIERIRDDTQYIIRFNLVARLTHITVVISFMLLALTGLPLLYHYAGWARPISDLLGGEGVARIIHKVCGAITFGYVFFHLVYITYLILRKKKHGVLYGADSLTPRPQDVFDMIANFRWFLYLGPRPKLDRWTYWEKFDYWAVFWGVAMIGLSGLAVWLFEPFTRILSGAYLNVAWVIHGEEALLAVGFIFVFHFFHNHMRPDNFPIDVTIFTGRLPLRRFREERPVLYRRLVEEGKLENLLVPPPSRITTILWQIFGYVVVTVGVALIVSVIIAMI